MKHYTDYLIESYLIEDAALDRAAAAKEFWNNANKNILDVTAFHKGYDELIKEYISLVLLFDDEGLFRYRVSYGTIKEKLPAGSTVLKACVRF